MKYAVYANNELVHVCSRYADTCAVTDWVIAAGYRTLVEEVSEHGTRVIFDAMNGNKKQ